jgi:hypothetical protein
LPLSDREIKDVIVSGQQTSSNDFALDDLDEAIFLTTVSVDESLGLNSVTVITLVLSPHTPRATVAVDATIILRVK